MSNLVPGVVLSILGLLLFALGRWGRDRVESLVPVGIPVQRRVKELRTIRRGAGSCRLLGVFCVFNGALFLVLAVTTQ